MIPSRKLVSLSLAALAIAGALALLGRAQSTPAPAAPSAAPPIPMNHNLVVLDPAHGGTDAGARLGDKLLEKDVTLALEARLKTALTAAGFTVVSTRDAELLTPLTGDQRADAANRTRAVACIVLHATASGTGVHLYASSLPPPDPPTTDIPDSDLQPVFEPKPWDTAQTDWVRQSLRLENDLGSALGAANLPVLKTTASVAPLDNLMCPAVAVEVAPSTPGGDASSVTAAAYQQQLTTALTQALLAWKGHADSGGVRGVDVKGADPADLVKAAAKASAAADAAGQAAARAGANGRTP